MKKLILTSAIAIMTAGTALAHEYKVGDLVIDHPVARATPANAPVSAGYMTITNNGSEDDTLIAATAPFSANVELHEMAMDGDVMKMREIDGGIVIPAGESVKLMPGGLHVMFMGMQQQLNEGETYEGTLTFENAGTINVTLNVESLTQIREAMGGKAMDHSGHDHPGHKHSDGDHSGHNH
ncbi:MAG: copper chaperone PCu(A)C [Pseudomonadota bacterium]